MKSFLIFVAIVIVSVNGDGYLVAEIHSEPDEPRLHYSDDETKTHSVSSVHSNKVHTNSCPECHCHCTRPNQHPLIPKCGHNERYYECKSWCSERCDNVRDRCVKEHGCNPGCRCLDGYVRIDSRCVPESECSRTEICPINEVYTDCVKNCNEVCSVEKDDCRDEIRCRPGCTCKKGYVRIDKRCVRDTNCPENCRRNEQWVPCFKRCNERCQLDQPACLNEKKCEPGCTCKPGYARIGTECLLISECPTILNCGVNKVYEECSRDDVCDLFCDEPESCPPFGRRPSCNVGCFCEKGYKFLDVESTSCIHKSQC